MNLRPGVKLITPEQLQEIADMWKPPIQEANNVNRQTVKSKQSQRVCTNDLSHRIRAYLATIPPAIQGQRGEDRAFYVAGRLIRGFDLTPSEAWPYLLEWDRRNVPPWGGTPEESKLYRKLLEQDKATGSRGFLLERSTDSFPQAGHPSADGEGTVNPKVFRNYFWDEIENGETTKRVKKSRRGVQMFEELETFTGGWPRRVGDVLFAPYSPVRDDLVWMDTSPKLFSWIDAQYTWNTQNQNGKNNGFDWAADTGGLTRQEFFAVCLHQAESWEQVEYYPHEPSMPGVYYHKFELAGGDGKTLEKLINRFTPATAADRQLIKAFFLSLFWGGPPGQRPMFLFESENDPKSSSKGRGAGKSTVAVMGSKLTGGYISLQFSANADDTMKRLLSPGATGKRVALFDNLKSLRASSQEIESWITAPQLSGKQMYVGERSRPNCLVWVITSNMPATSKDLAQRCIVVKVSAPVYSPEWVGETEAFIEDNRWSIIGDCLAWLRLPILMPEGFTYTRWSAWEAGVLSHCENVLELQSLIIGRRDDVDDDDDISASVVESIRSLLTSQGFDPDKQSVLIPSGTMCERVIKEHMHHYNKSIAMQWLYTLSIPNIEKGHRNREYRGALWKPTSVIGTDEVRIRVYLWNEGGLI